MTSLSVVSYIERINRMYRLIRKESTGSRAELAGRMRVSERTVSNYLEELRLMGADIRFSKTRNTVSIRPRACFSPSYNKVKSQTKHVWLLTLL